jgi:ankyrin repeat protein
MAVTKISADTNTEISAETDTETDNFLSLLINNIGGIFEKMDNATKVEQLLNQQFEEEEEEEETTSLPDLTILKSLYLDGPISQKMFEFESQTQKTLHLACQQGNLKAVKRWMNDHEQEELPRDDSLGRYPIHYAAENGHAAIVDYLANCFGYNVNQKTVPSLLTEKTALHFAVENNLLEVVQVLLKHGADVLETDQNQKTPIEIAKEKGYLEILELLQHHQSEIG